MASGSSLGPGPPSGRSSTARRVTRSGDCRPTTPTCRSGPRATASPSVPTVAVSPTAGRCGISGVERSSAQCPISSAGGSQRSARTAAGWWSQRRVTPVASPCSMPVPEHRCTSCLPTGATPGSPPTGPRCCSPTSTGRPGTGRSGSPTRPTATSCAPSPRRSPTGRSRSTEAPACWRGGSASSSSTSRQARRCRSKRIWGSVPRWSVRTELTRSSTAWLLPTPRSTTSPGTASRWWTWGPDKWSPIWRTTSRTSTVGWRRPSSHRTAGWWSADSPRCPRRASMPLRR